MVGTTKLLIFVTFRQASSDVDDDDGDDRASHEEYLYLFMSIVYAMWVGGLVSDNSDVGIWIIWLADDVKYLPEYVLRLSCIVSCVASYAAVMKYNIPGAWCYVLLCVLVLSSHACDIYEIISYYLDVVAQ